MHVGNVWSSDLVESLIGNCKIAAVSKSNNCCGVCTAWGGLQVVCALRGEACRWWVHFRALQCARV